MCTSFAYRDIAAVDTDVDTDVDMAVGTTMDTREEDVTRDR